jgi:hypothetical protein
MNRIKFFYNDCKQPQKVTVWLYPARLHIDQDIFLISLGLIKEDLSPFFVVFLEPIGDGI